MQKKYDLPQRHKEHREKGRIQIAKSAKKYRERSEGFKMDTSRHNDPTVNIG